MFRQILAALLASVVLFTNSSSALAGTREERTRKLAEKVSSIPEGAIVDVRTIDDRHFRGRIGQMTATEFSVQTVHNEKVETVAVEYENAKSVKVIAVKDAQRGTGAKTGGWVLIGGLAAVGAIAIISIAVALAGGY